MVLDDCDSPLGRAGGLAVYPLATLWLLVGMAFVAEEYFSVALEGIVEKYHVPDAVAGATVLAVGTSFPELIIGFVAQFLSRDADPSITLGVTLGSAIFNQLAIVGACALVAPGGALRVQWRAMLRDVLVWGATIVITAGCLANGKVSALEGWLMVAFYALYVVICAYWSRIISRFAPPPRVVRKAAEPAAKPGEIIYVPVPVTFEDQLKAICRTPSAATLNRAAGRPAQTPSAARLAAPTPTANPLHDDAPPPGFREIELREVEAPGDLRVRSPSTERKEAPTEETKAQEEAPDDHGPLGRRPRAGGAAGCVAMSWFVAKAPFSLVCYYGGLPALRRRGLWEALALAAAALIAGFSYLMVQCLELTSCLVGVPTITLSLLVVASGTCLPELVVAMVVARKGQATAAVSTALGSNVFDILIALGLPWAIYASAYGPVHIAHAFELTLLMALSTVVFLVISLTNAWTYTARHGYFLLVLYFLFNVYVVLDAIPATNVPGPSGI